MNDCSALDRATDATIALLAALIELRQESKSCGECHMATAHKMDCGTGSDQRLAELRRKLTAPWPALYSLIEAAEQLQARGIDTGQHKLKQYLNEGICWTDGINSPRPCADGYLWEDEPPRYGRDAVVRITEDGINELARVMGLAV